MAVCVEAKRVMIQALNKIYTSRKQRGGLPLHRTLLLTLVMRTARDAYHSARAQNHGPDPSGQSEHSVHGSRSEPSDPGTQSSSYVQHTHSEELMDTAQAQDKPCAFQTGEGTLKQNTADKENCNSADRQAQSRKRKGKLGTEPDFLPCKKARLEPAELRGVLHSSPRRNGGTCARQTDLLSAAHIPRTVLTY